MSKLRVDQMPVQGKTVLVRVDFNVPLKEGAVRDDTRIKAALPTIEHLRKAGAQVVLMSHLGRPKGEAKPELSLRPVAAHLGKLLGTQVAFSPEIVGPQAQAAAQALKPGGVLLLENLRFDPREEKNDAGFAKELAALGDLFVSDAFGTVHRAHASTAGVAAHFPQSACGFLIAKELEFLGQVVDNPPQPFVAVLGGAKVGDKIAVIRNLLTQADTLLIGGAMAYTFLKQQGHGIGKSLLDEPHVALAGELLAEAMAKGKRILLPLDHTVSDKAEAGAQPQTSGIDIAEGLIGLDIGPKTIAAYEAEIAKAALVFWNGPMGMFELPGFQAGSFAIAKAMAACKGTTVVGGGESVQAVNQAGVAAQLSHISTGGGASLEFVEGRRLPGVDVLTDAPAGA